MTPSESGLGDSAMLARLRLAYEAFLQGNLQPILQLVAPDVEWTFLDPSLENPYPQVCHGRAQLQAALRARSASGLRTELEQLH